MKEVIFWALVVILPLIAGASGYYCGGLGIRPMSMADSKAKVARVIASGRVNLDYTNKED